MDLSRKSLKRYEGIMSQIRGRIGHSIKRAWQRYNIEIDEYEYFELVNQIVSEKALKLKDIDSGKSIWKVKCKGKIMYAVYTKKHMSICTFLSEEMV